MLRAEYSDGTDKPRSLGLNKKKLKNPRIISTTLSKDNRELDV